MNSGQLKLRKPTFGDKGHAFLALIIIAGMLGVMYVPVFVVFFFGIFAYFVYKSVSDSTRSLTREIFEFYLTANEMLRDDERRWFGFEIREAIGRGESIIERMPAAPPLLRFAIGALYNKIGEHKSAISYLAPALEQSSGNEINIVYPTSELRDYVRVLRKIERSPAEAPLTSAAVRALERTRRFRGSVLLEESRKAFANYEPKPLTASDSTLRPLSEGFSGESEALNTKLPSQDLTLDAAQNNSGMINPRSVNPETSDQQQFDSRYNARKSISEVLHDIYDNQVSR